jgi:L-fucose isomerase-like protein
MHLPLGTFAPKVKLGLVSASRNCFPRALSEARTKKLAAECRKLGLQLFAPQGDCRIIETRDHAQEAARQMQAAGCDAAVLYLGNFSPEIEDAVFAKDFPGPLMILAAAEESAATLCGDRGDALCGLLSTTMAIKKRGLWAKTYLPANPLVSAESGARAVAEFIDIMRVVKGVRGATIGLFGPRPRDFETCNYNVSAIMALGVEVEELGLFDLINETQKIKPEQARAILKSMKTEIGSPYPDEFLLKLAVFERAMLNYRERLKLSGATTQCWAEQEFALGHVPCFINARLAGRGFPVACENDVYSLVAELMAQYASRESVTILDINHSIPADLLPAKLAKLPIGDLVGMFHCGNTCTTRIKKPAMKYQLIMKRVMEPEKKEPEISRGTIEGHIAGSPLTLVQIHGDGDAPIAYIAEGEFLDIDPKTFGGTGTAYIPGFQRFYRNVLLGRFHHHTAVAFTRCGATLQAALTLLGVKSIYSPLPAHMPYPGENMFTAGLSREIQ